MYLRFDVGAPACLVPTKNRNEPVVGFRGRCEGKKVTASRPPSSWKRTSQVENEFHSVRDKKIRYRQPDLFDPTKLPLISRRLPRATLSFRSALNRRLIDFSSFRRLLLYRGTVSFLGAHVNYMSHNGIRSLTADRTRGMDSALDSR